MRGTSTKQRSNKPDYNTQTLTPLDGTLPSRSLLPCSLGLDGLKGASNRTHSAIHNVDVMGLGTRFGSQRGTLTSNNPTHGITTKNIVGLQTRSCPPKNLLSPVSRIPPEISTQIFGLVVHEESETAMQLQQLMLVSRLWRAIVDGTPALWSRIAPGRVGGVGYLTRALSRSGNLPLTVDYNFQTTYKIPPNPFLTEISKHILRWREVRLVLSGRSEAISLLNALPPERLESFHCDIVNDRGGYIPIFGGRTLPALRHVSLRSCGIHWSSGQLSNLNTLDLSHFNQHNGPSLEQFLEILDQCPLLTTLRFHHLLHPSTRDVQTCPPSFSLPIQLDHLKSLNLQANPHVLGSILQNISFPNCERVELDSRHLEEGWTELASQALAPHASVLQSIVNASETIRVNWSSNGIVISTSSKTQTTSFRLRVVGEAEHPAVILGWFVENLASDLTEVHVAAHLERLLWSPAIPTNWFNFPFIQTRNVPTKDQATLQLLQQLGMQRPGDSYQRKAELNLPYCEVLRGFCSTKIESMTLLLQRRHKDRMEGVARAVDLPSPLTEVPIRRNQGALLGKTAFWKRLRVGTNGD